MWGNVIEIIVHEKILNNPVHGLLQKIKYFFGTIPRPAYVSKLGIGFKIRPDKTCCQRIQ